MREPSELYGELVDRRVEPSALTREELRAVLEWMETRFTIMENWRMVVDLQAEYFRQGTREAAAPVVVWRYLAGRRTQHAFIGDAGMPVCGALGVRADGTARQWRDARETDSLGFRLYEWGPRVQHAECVRLLGWPGVHR